VGINITALIQEEDAATYLYWHNTKTLTEVIDTNVKGFVQGVLAREFGGRTLEKAKTEKNAVFAKADAESKEHFKKYGITILNIGNAGGLEYDDEEIQKAINKTQTSEMGVKVALQEKLAQVERNAKDVAQAVAARQAAEEFAKAKEAQMAKIALDIKMVEAQAMMTQAQATLEASKKWDGKVPSQILPQGSNLLFGLDKSSGSK
jgi:regulator of protease activity HflC (stomatin/prohibitin superfamily)